MLIRGKIPGCCRLMRRDFNLVGDEGYLQPPPAVLQDLGAPKQVIEINLTSKEEQAEMSTLLRKFLSLRRSFLFVYYCWIWDQLPSRRSTFHRRKGRLALLRQLKKQMEKIYSHALEDFVSIPWNILRTLSRAFYNPPHCAITAQDDQNFGAGPTRQKLLKKCRHVLDETSDYFGKQGFCISRNSPSYTHLVVAHYRMSNEASQRV